MLKSGQKRPNIAEKIQTASIKEWRQFENQVVLSSSADGCLNFTIEGGSDNGQFAHVSDIVQSKVNYTSGRLSEGDIITEIQGQKVAGYTQRDVVAWLNHCCKNGNPVTLFTISAGEITRDLRDFLNTRYPKGSGGHELQNIIRDNVYLRTVPVTTREPREGEVHGLDYLFLSCEEFMVLERNGNLLESGIYEGNHYGTPKPSREPAVSPPQSGGSEASLNLNWFIPGAHPSSEGKRRRNRSNVEAMSAKDMEPARETPNGQQAEEKPSGNNTTLPCYVDTGEFEADVTADLGPLPSNWEKAYTEKGEVYFIDHNTGTSHWLDPRLSKFQKKSLKECLDDELPYGWEKIEDPDYGTYYIDHVNRRTQYENPVLMAKRGGELDPEAPHSFTGDSTSDHKNDNYPSYGKTGSESGNGSHHHQQALEPYHHPPAFEDRHPFFTRNPNELRGERIRTVLVKSSRGLGFTIVGGDETVEEFLQIKSVVPNGPAWLDGKLQMGDVLVYVNDTCLLGFTHHDMVNVFQSIAPGETVKLEVCRGYPLPFDPNDPNTEVVTTVAVGALDSVANDLEAFLEDDQASKNQSELFDSSVVGNHVRSNSDDMLNSSVKSMPDLCTSEKVKNMQRPNSTDVLLEDPNRTAEDYFNEPPAIPEKPEFLSISILKGPMGFGFTIADSAYGQKVKKILDRVRCKNLMEGDILVDINSVNVRNMCHSDVVQVLKDCERNQEATVTVQRGPNSPNKQRLKRNDFAAQAPGLGPYRSKTPTADLYSTQPKEIMPHRPKTPLVDTRVRSKTPVLHGWNNEDVKLSPSGLYQLSSQQHYLQERLSKTNLNENYQKSDGFVRENHYPKSDSFLRDRLNQTEQHNLSEVDALQKSGYGYYNGYVEDNFGYQEEYPTYDPNQYVLKPVGASITRQPYFHHDRVVDGYISSHHKQSSPRFPVQIKGKHPGVEYLETVVSLVRQDTGFGFRIVGGTEEGSQVGGTVSIGHIVAGGAADLDGRLCTGDEILSVDGQNVVNTSHHHVVQLMGKAAANGSVAIGLRRRIPLPPDGEGVMCSPGTYPYDVTVTRMEDEGFGFVIISSLNRSGSTIGRIIKGSPAERCGQLHVGDHILAVNHFDITALHHGDIVNLIKDSGFSVTLTIGPPFEDTSSNASVSHREELEADEGYEGGRRGRGFDYPPMRSPRDPAGPLGPLGTLPEEEQYHAVELNRGSRGFGFSIRGGKEFHNMPLYVLQIAETGPAAVNEKLKIGDQIIEINGINTKNMTHAEAIEIIRKGGPTVRLLVRRGEKPPPPPPPPPSGAGAQGDY